MRLSTGFPPCFWWRNAAVHDKEATHTNAHTSEMVVARCESSDAGEEYNCAPFVRVGCTVSNFNERHDTAFTEFSEPRLLLSRLGNFHLDKHEYLPCHNALVFIILVMFPNKPRTAHHSSHITSALSIKRSPVLLPAQFDLEFCPW